MHIFEYAHVLLGHLLDVHRGQLSMSMADGGLEILKEFLGKRVAIDVRVCDCFVRLYLVEELQIFTSFRVAVLAVIYMYVCKKVCMCTFVNMLAACAVLAGVCMHNACM
jgi:hypothetical protein